jgi:translation elongation factor EF-1beta
LSPKQPLSLALHAVSQSAEARDVETKAFNTDVQNAHSKDHDIGEISMGQVVVKYKITLNQPEDERPDYDGIAGKISVLDEVQTIAIKPLAFGMMFIEIDVVLGEGEGIVDGFEDKIRSIDSMISQIEALEMGRL